MASAAATDADLVKRARSGHRPALDALVSRHYRAVYETAYWVLGDAADAADATQDAFVRALGALSSYRGDATFRTWLLKVAANTARDRRRRSSRRREVGLTDQIVATVENTPEANAVARDEAERIDRVMARLPEKQRMAVTLRLHEDLSHREIGEIIGCSEGSARVNYHLGIKKLRKLLT